MECDPWVYAISMSDSNIVIFVSDDANLFIYLTLQTSLLM